MKKLIIGLAIVIYAQTTFAVKITVSTIVALQSAINSASAGDTIILANGTYLNNSINISKSNIVVKAATPGGVFLNGTNSISLNGNYITFSGFQFITGSIGSSYVILVYGSHNILTQLNFNGYLAKKYIEVKAGTQYNEISYCNIEHKPDTSIAGAVLGCAIQINTSPTIPGYHKIRYCSFQNFPGLGGDYGNEPVRIGLSTESTNNSRTIVEHCYFNNTGLGDGENISVKCCENVIRYCTFTNNPEGMLVFRNGNRNIAYGNFFINGSGGIRIKEANDIYCYNNYFETAGTSGTANAIAFNYISPNLTNINLLYNTFVDCGDIDLGGVGPTNVTISNNIFKKNTGNIFSSPNNSTTWLGNIYSGTLGISIPLGMTNINPQLILNTDNYYGLSSTSPAINASGSAFPAILDIANVDDDPLLMLDISGQIRPSSISLKDVGCDEYTTGTILNRPLTVNDVGPSYLAAGCTVPSAPSGLTVLTNTCNSVGVSWNAVTGTDITYEVFKNNIACNSAFSSSGLGPIANTNGVVNTTPGTAYYFVVVASNTCGASVNSNCVNVTTPSLVTPAVSISANPSGAICSGTSVTFTATSTNGGSSPVYQWKKNGVNLATGTTYSSTSLTNGNVITCVLTSNVNCASTTTATSSGITMTVNSLPVATVTPAGPITMCAGQTTTLSVNTTAGQTYRWQKNSVNISGATSPNYIATKSGSYRVRVTNSFGCIRYSAPVSITVNCRIVNIDRKPFALIENSLTDVSIFPNPSVHDFSVEVKSKNDLPVTIHVMDASGRIILNQNILANRKFTLGAEFVSGIYFVKIISTEEIKVLKIIKTQ